MKLNEESQLSNMETLVNKNICSTTQYHCATEEKIRVSWRMRGEEETSPSSTAAEDRPSSMYYSWSREYLGAGRKGSWATWRMPRHYVEDRIRCRGMPPELRPSCRISTHLRSTQKPCKVRHAALIARPRLLTGRGRTTENVSPGLELCPRVTVARLLS